MIEIDVRGDELLLRGLAAAQADIPDALERAMQQSLLLIEADARRTVKQDTRALMNSIHHRIDKQGDTIEGRVGPSLQYGIFVELGTRPHWPPRAPLEGWARRHHIPVFLVQRAIARRGTRRAPFLLPAFESNKKAITDLFAKVGATVVNTIVRGGR